MPSITTAATTIPIPTAAATTRFPAASCFDNALPPPYLQHLQSALAPNAPFWEEHAYNSPTTGKVF